MDVQMPEMDGFEATQRIRTEWPVEQQPYIIAMTAYALTGDAERCLAAGMNDYISKPVQLEKLVAALEKSEAHLRASSTL
jgi:CheY-like chemotaxis protein